MTIAGASIVSSFQSIERAINQINTAWNRPEQIYNNQLTGQICYMDYAQGDRLEFYMRLDGQADEDKGDTETRNFGTPESVKVASVGFKRIDLFSELLPMYPNRDPLGIFLGPTEEGVMKAMRLPTRRAALLLRQGLTKTCVYDGLPFFSISHKVNPADPKNANVFPNYFTNFKITEDGWADFLDQYEQIIGANDYVINQGFAESGAVIWCAQRRQAKKFLKFFDPEGRIYTGNTTNDRPNLDTAAAAESTVFTPRMGFRMPTIEVVPELVARPADADYAASKKRIFIFNTRYPMRRALVCRVPRTMMVKIDRSVSNPYAASNNAYPFWADMDFGIDFALPHLCALLEEP